MNMETGAVTEFPIFMCPDCTPMIEFLQITVPEEVR